MSAFGFGLPLNDGPAPRRLGEKGLLNVQAAITRAGDCLQRVREAKRDCENLRVIVERVARREVLKKEIAVAAREIEAARPGGGQGAASSKKRARH